MFAGVSASFCLFPLSSPLSPPFSCFYVALFLHYCTTTILLLLPFAQDCVCIFSKAPIAAELRRQRLAPDKISCFSTHLPSLTQPLPTHVFHVHPNHQDPNTPSFFCLERKLRRFVVAVQHSRFARGMI